MSTNINAKASTSRTEVTVKVTSKSLRQKMEEIQAEETVGKPENAKKIKITENVLKQQNNILHKRNQELSEKVEMCLAILKDPRNVMSLHDYILQRQEKDTKPLQNSK